MADEPGVAARTGAVALLLAAGESTRMGRPKPLLEWNGRTLIEYQVGELLAAGAGEVVVVLGHRAEEVRPYAERAGGRVALNPAYREGRAGSIRAGAAVLQNDVSAIVILSVDQPRGRDITRAVLAEHLGQDNVITVPVFDGRRGHPAVLSGRLLTELREVEESTEGLRAIMQRHAAERREVVVDDRAVLLDLNLPSDYEAAISERT